MEERSDSPRQFPETRWTLVLQASNDDSKVRDGALSDLCVLYWPPVYAFIRSKGFSEHDAEDLTQGFFAQFLSREDFARTDAKRGRLRSYLMGAAAHYLASEHRRANREKRGGGVQILSFDVEEAESRVWIPDPADELTPEKIFDRQWATTLLENVIRQLEARYRESGKAKVFDALKPFVKADGASERQGEIARELGMSESAVRVAIHRLRQRYGALLRETVVDTLGPDESVEDELRELMAVFR